MAPSRNDPCPCGSGKKYKQCCLDADNARARSVRLVQGTGAQLAGEAVPIRVSLEALRSIDRDDTWELDAIPVQNAAERQSAGRICVRLLSIGDHVIDAAMDNAPPSEPADVAAMLVQWMHDVVARCRNTSGIELPLPEILRVRHASVAQHVAALIGESTRVVHASRLPVLDRVAGRVGGSISEYPVSALGNAYAPTLSDTTRDRDEDPDSGAHAGVSLVSFPSTWAAWQIDPDALAELMANAVAFHSAQPWRRLTEVEALRISMPTDSLCTYTAVVIGANGDEYGVSLYENDADYMRMFSSADPASGLTGVDGAVLTLYFDPKRELSREMQQEFKRHAWPISGADAFPVLCCANTPAGGISVAQVAHLSKILRALATLVTTPHILPGDAAPLAEPSVWLDEATGVRVEYAGSRSPGAVPLWSIPSVLSYGCVRGAGTAGARLFERDLASDAEIDAALAREFEQLNAFAEWLTRDRGERLRARGALTADTHLATAQLYIEHLALGHCVTLRTMHEFHLRSFLYFWYPLNEAGAARNIAGVLASLKRMFAWLETQQVECAWATSILDDRDAVNARIANMPTPSPHGEVAFWWSDQLNDDLYARVMVADPLVPIADGDAELGMPGEKEQSLFDEVMVRTLTWREQAIANGITSPPLVREFCADQQRVWETTRHPRFGKSPAAVIRQERRKLAHHDDTSGAFHPPWPE